MGTLVRGATALLRDELAHLALLLVTRGTGTDHDSIQAIKTALASKTHEVVVSPPQALTQQWRERIAVSAGLLRDLGSFGLNLKALVHDLGCLALSSLY